MSGVRLVIVDDDSTIRKKLRVIVEAHGADVLAEAQDGRGGIDEAERLQPELILLDVSMPVMGGFSAARYLHEHMPQLRIILVSQYNQRVYAEEALQIGADGYVLKSAVASELSMAITTVMAGGTYISSRITL